LIINNKSLGINIIITTPQLFLNTFSKLSHLNDILSDVKYIVLDECDKYFEESFIEQIKNML
jgi:superfamily II DNA/RNA helicase